MRLRHIAAAGLAPLLLIVGLPGTTASATNAPTGSPAEEAFRGQLGTYLQDLQGALTAVATNPVTAATQAPNANDGKTSLAAAEAQVSQLTSQQLDAMQGILGKSPNWQQQPTNLTSAMSSVQVAAKPKAANTITPHVAFLNGYINSCSSAPTNASLSALFYSYWVAAQVASAANAVASGMPDGVDFAVADIIAGVAFGVANGIAIGLGAALAAGQDCATAGFNTTLENSFPSDPEGGTNFVPASTQVSVDALAALVGGVKTTLDAIQLTINEATADLTEGLNTLGVAQGTANNIQATAIDLQSRTDALLATIGTAGDTTTPVCETAVPTTCTANGLANTINTRMDTILANTASLQAVQLRAEIERALAAAGPSVVTLYALPSSQGGYLELVASIVTQTVNTETSIGNAQMYLAAGNQKYGAGQFEAAYQQYALAYQTAAR
jgi:hypothetical protein